MITLDVKTLGGKTAFAPGGRIEGSASWYFDEGVKTLELRLFWYTEGRGQQDVEMVGLSCFEAPQPQESRSFSFRLPESPFSFSGSLITLNWSLELVAQPSGEAARLGITVSPTGRPISLSGQKAAT